MTGELFTGLGADYALLAGWMFGLVAGGSAARGLFCLFKREPREAGVSSWMAALSAAASYYAFQQHVDLLRLSEGAETGPIYLVLGAMMVAGLPIAVVFSWLLPDRKKTS